MIKTTSELGIEGNFFNLGKGIYPKPTSIIILDDVKNILFKIRKEREGLLSLLFFNIVLEVLASSEEEKEK